MKKSANILFDCPFCGSCSFAVQVDKLTWIEQKKVKLVVVCLKCGACSGLCETVKEVIDAWNRREIRGGLGKKL